MRVFEGDEETINSILKTRGEFADDGMYKWWLAFSSRLPKFKFDRRKLRLLNRKLDEKSKKELGIFDTEVEDGPNAFAYDHVSGNVGIGGGGGTLERSMSREPSKEGGTVGWGIRGENSNQI